MTTLFPGETGNRAHYRGDVTEAVMTATEPFGPDLYGALYTPVGVTYDAETDRSTVQFRPIPRSNRPRGLPMPEELPPMTRQQYRQFARETKKAQRRKEKSRR